MISENTGAYVKVVAGGAPTALTAAGTGDNTQIVGNIVDRNANYTPLSGVFAVAYNTTLAASQTLSLAYTIEGSDNSDLSSPTTLATATSYVIVPSATAAQTVSGVVEVNLNFRTAGQYVRGKFTPDLSASGTDTAGVAAVWVLGGSDTLPL